MRHNIRFVDILGFSWGLSLCVGLLLSVVANADDLSGSEPGNSILKSDAAESWDNEMNRPIHTSWGAEDYSNDFSHSPPDGVPLSVSSSYIKTTFGVTKVFVQVVWACFGLHRYIINLGRILLYPTLAEN
jgi:hypothetical protein